MKIRSKVTIGLLSSAMCVAALVHAQSYKYKKVTGPESVTFKTTAARKTIQINGYVPGLAIAQSEGANIVLKADLEKMVMGEDADMGTMDKARADHAKKELRVKQHPMAELKVKKDSVKVGKDLKGSGKFSLAGKQQDIQFKYTAVEAGNKVKVKGSFVISLSKHGIKEICMTEICVADQVTVNAAFTMEKAPE